MIIAVVVTAGLLMAVIHWYLWKRLVRDVSRPGGRFRKAGTVLAVALPLVSTVSLGGREMGVPFEVLQVIGWPGNYWYMGLLYLLPCLLLADLVGLMARRRGRVREADGQAGLVAVVPGAGEAAETAEAAGGERKKDGSEAAAEEPEASEPERGPGTAAEPAGPGRRLVIARGVAVGSLALTAGVMGYGSWAARQLRTKHVTVPLAKLPRAAHGYRIAVVSDIHLGPLLGRSHAQRVVDTVNRTQPDLITVVGDLVDAEVDDLRSAVAPLAGLTARHGAFYVTGNHEYMVNTREWVEHVRELGLTPLENAREELPHFDLAGVNDEDGRGTDFGGPDYEAALGDRDTARATVLMAHQPVQIHEAVDYGVDLQLSGHTHGGQLWPASYIAALANPTLAGLERYGDTQLYVTRGAGAFGAPVRVGADPDITVITLASAQA